jgi:hypothetical protein
VVAALRFAAVLLLALSLPALAEAPAGVDRGVAVSAQVLLPDGTQVPVQGGCWLRAEGGAGGAWGCDGGGGWVGIARRVVARLALTLALQALKVPHARGAPLKPLAQKQNVPARQG